jgi:tetratricopeptide (TPR) repeat protein
VLTPVAAVIIYVQHRRAGPDIKWSWGISWGVGVAVFIAVMMVMHSNDPRKWNARGSPEGLEYFFPASSLTVDGNFIPARALMMDEYCLKCHPDIYNSHLHSAHKFSSFNNPAYLFSVTETRKRMSPRAARWCAGCHDPVPFFSGQFDDPDYDMKDHPTAKAGITCTVCHAMTHVNSRAGNGDYTIEEPIHYPFAYSDNTILQWLNNQLVKAKPDFHKKTFLKDFHKTEAFCSTCHKVGVPQPVNHYKEFLRGQDHNTSFWLSGQSGYGARSFYYPPKARANCAECHMPLQPSDDFGGRDFDGSGTRKIHNHLFPGANTGVPALVRYPGYEDVIEAHKKFVQKGADGKSPTMRIDLFGIKHLSGDQGVEAPLINDQPLRPNLPRIKPGQTYMIEAVIRTLNIGHHFTQGTADSNEVWVDLTARSGGRVIARSGGMDQGEDKGRVDESSHFINVLMLDRHGNRIDRRNPQDIFTPLYNHQIPPGAAQVVHYRLQVPPDVTAPVELTTRVRFRKFDYTYMEKVHEGKSVPQLPIVDLCSDSIVLPVAGGKDVAEQKSPIPPWQRWNDYGIACFLEGGTEGKDGGELAQAEAAFSKLLGPEFKDVKEASPNGHLNLARVHLAYRGQERLSKARQSLSDAARAGAPWWTVAWFNGVVNLQNTNFDEAIRDFEQILDPKNRDRRRGFDFSKDYVVRNELGKALFFRAQQEEGADDRAYRTFLRRAIGEFERTLDIDAEDVVAHEFLNKCYNRLGKDAPSVEAARSQGGSLALQLLHIAGEPQQNSSKRIEAARELVRLLAKDTSALNTQLLVRIRRSCLAILAAQGNVGVRLLIAQLVSSIDRHLLARVPELGKRLVDTGRVSADRLGAARELDAALDQLALRPGPVDARSLVGFAAAWPEPGLPVNLALQGLADRGYLQGPLPPPRLIALQTLRSQVRPLFDSADAELNPLSARILGRIHLVLHGIFKPDENAQGLAQQRYREKHPAAARASLPIVIYDMHLERPRVAVSRLSRQQSGE